MYNKIKTAEFKICLLNASGIFSAHIEHYSIKCTIQKIIKSFSGRHANPIKVNSWEFCEIA